MEHEYSYFRARGKSLVAIETVEASKKKFETLRQDVRKRYGAAGLFLRHESFHIQMLVFDKGKAPEGWEKPDKVSDSETLDSRLPPAGTADHFYIKNMEGLMERAFRNSRLENVFGCGEMPMRELEAGLYSRAFVRRRTWVAEWRDNISFVPKGEGEGNLPAPLQYGSGSNAKGSMGDPLQHVKIAQDYYIRVPNDAGGKPRFTPPDAEPLAYLDMLMIDLQATQTSLRPPSIH